MKKILSALLALALTLSLTACNGAPASCAPGTSESSGESSMEESSAEGSSEELSEETEEETSEESEEPSESSKESTKPESSKASTPASSSNNKPESSKESKPESSNKPVSESSKETKPESSKETVTESSAVASTPASSEESKVVESSSASAEPVAVTPAMLSVIEAEFLRLVNEERARCGVGALTVNSSLDSAAQVRAGEILVSFSHTRPNGEKCFTAIDQTAYPYSTAGENIGTSFHTGEEISSRSPAFTGSNDQLAMAAYGMFQGFKNSPGHYANMIKADYVHTGIGITYTDTPGFPGPTFYFAHFFGAL